jgi:RNA polymerase sigma-70 factor (ECF subfamily)
VLDTSDESLVARARQGEMPALGELYDRHHLHIYRFILVRVGSQPEAEDLTGAVFMRMLDGLPSYRPRAGIPFRAWLFRIARNLLVDYFRRQGRRAEVSLDAAGSQTAPGSPEEAAEQGLALERLHGALAHLTEAQREVIVLRFMAGLSLDEVAGITGHSRSAVKALQHRGLAALREALTGKWE